MRVARPSGGWARAPVRSAGAAAAGPIVILLHRLAREPEPFHLNPDLVLTVEAHPDTIITLTSGVRIPVTETPDAVRNAIAAWRSGLLIDALRAVGLDSSVVSLNRARADR